MSIKNINKWLEAERKVIARLTRPHGVSNIAWSWRYPAVNDVYGTLGSWPVTEWLGSGTAKTCALYLNNRVKCQTADFLAPATKFLAHQNLA